MTAQPLPTTVVVPTLPTTVVVPTIGRPSLAVLLAALDACLDRGRPPAGLIVVDDRPAADADVAPLHVESRLPVRVVRSGGRGPAAARNRGWRSARTPWVSFLDDDVVPEPDWLGLLEHDLEACGPDVAGTQGQVRVPLPRDRRPTDWERGTAGLAECAWITADMSYRRRDLAGVGGFDERFPRAFREDADLALRVLDRGRELVRGGRRITHPVRPADDWVSLRVQRGNADDVLMRRLHGSGWHAKAQASRGRTRSQRAMTLALGVAAGALAARRSRLAGLAFAGYLGGAAEFAWARVRPGPRDAAEVRRMLLTSMVIPPYATWNRTLGWWRHRAARPWVGLPDLVLFDRDGTLVHDVPYNGDPGLVKPVDEARDVLDELRDLGVRVGVATNQSGIGRGLNTPEQVRAVNDEVERQLGPFDVFLCCPHAPGAGCDCRKPAPGMVLEACERLDVPVDRCVVIGDIASDVEAARAAGARGILVPNAATSPADVRSTARTAHDLRAALKSLLQCS